MYEQDILWIRLRQCLLWLENSGPLMGLLPPPIRRFFRGRETVFVLLATVVVVLFAYVLNQPGFGWWRWPILGLVVWRTVEIALILVSVAFVSRGQRDPLRSLVLWMFNYFQVVVAFGCFYWSLPAAQFNRPLNSVWDAAYFRTVTSVTLGDAAISPVGKWSKIVVAVEPGVALVFVAAVLSVLLSHLDRIPIPSLAMTPGQLAQKSAELWGAISEAERDHG